MNMMLRRYIDHSEALDVLGNTVFVEETLHDFNVLILGLFFSFALVVVPGSPLSLGLKLNSPGFFIGAVSKVALLVESVE